MQADGQVGVQLVANEPPRTMDTTAVRSERELVRTINTRENILEMVQRSPRLSTRRMASHIGVSRMQVWRTLHGEDLYPYHDQRVQHLEPDDHAQRMDLCRWITAHPELLSVILFSDEASFTRDGINDSRNVHTWSHENPHGTRVTNFQRRFSVNVWCGVLGNSVKENTYEAFLRNELPGLFEDIPFMVRSQMHFQHIGAPPHYTWHVREYLNESFPIHWLGRGWPVAWAPRSPDLTFLIITSGAT